MVPRTKEELRKLVSETTIEMYEEMTPQLIKLIDETKHDDSLTEAQKQAILNKAHNVRSEKEMHDLVASLARPTM